MTSYVVTAPVVLAKVQDDQHGWAYKHLQTGTPVPPEVGQEWITGHLACGMIAAVAEPAPPPAAPPLAEPAPKPPAGSGGGGGASSADPGPAVPVEKTQAAARGGARTGRG
jgi:hypothetical protein